MGQGEEETTLLSEIGRLAQMGLTADDSSGELMRIL